MRRGGTKFSHTCLGSVDLPTQAEISFRVSFLTVLILATRGCFNTCSPFCCTADEMFSESTCGDSWLVKCRWEFGLSIIVVTVSNFVSEIFW